MFSVVRSIWLFYCTCCTQKFTKLSVDRTGSVLTVNIKIMILSAVTPYSLVDGL